MADWQRQVWLDIMEVDGVLPPSGSRVLVLGGHLPVRFAADIRVVLREWGQPFAEDGGFERIVISAAGNVSADFQLTLSQVWPLLRPDGLLIVVAARPSPWGVRYSAWWRGYPRKVWLQWLRSANWLLADDFTVGFCAGWAKYVPFVGGPVRVFLAQKRVGGMKVLAHTPQKGIVAKPVGVPV